MRGDKLKKSKQRKDEDFEEEANEFETENQISMEVETPVKHDDKIFDKNGPEEDASPN